MGDGEEWQFLWEGSGRRVGDGEVLKESDQWFLCEGGGWRFL